MFKIIDSNESYEDNIQNLKSSRGYTANDLYISISGSTCKSKLAFFEVMKTRLNFAKHFADNWDSFSDCVFEFLMLENKNIQVYFSDVSFLLCENKNDLTIFREILEELSQNDYKKEITFIFQKNK